MSGSVVVDPSLAVAWMVQEVHSDAARVSFDSERRRVTRPFPLGVHAGRWVSAQQHGGRSRVSRDTGVTPGRSAASHRGRR